MNAISLLGTALGLGLTSGLNLYATTFITGLLIRLGWLALPPSLDGLQVLADPVVLVVSGVMFAVEALADKIPVVDHAWDLLHTVIRPVGACVLAWRAVGGAAIPEPAEIAIILLAGGAAFSTHSAKAGSRVAIAGSGGHLVGAGVGASLLEDGVALVLAPLAIAHPIVMFVIAVATLAVIGLLAVRIFRLLRTVPQTLQRVLRRGIGGRGGESSGR